MRFCCISDSHNKHKQITIPECDILFHTGDWSFQGNKSETENFAKWLEKQPAKNIVLIPGNHEKVFEKCIDGLGTEESPNSKDWIYKHCPRANLLIHESLELNGIKIFGSPWTPYFFNWAWNAGRTITEAAPFIGDLWKDIPNDTQILLTHGPSMGILDTVTDYNTGRMVSAGCSELSKKINDLKDLKMHLFGHLHFEGGRMVEQDGVIYVNSAVVDDRYIPNDNRKVVIDIYPELNWQYLRL